MGQVNVTVGDHSYPLACRDGEEERLARLAGHLNRKAEELSATLGRMSEPRLLLMAGILVADELFEAKENGRVPAPSSPAVQADPETAALLTRLAGRVEALADMLASEAEETTAPLEQGPDSA